MMKPYWWEGLLSPRISGPVNTSCAEPNQVLGRSEVVHRSLAPPAPHSVGPIAARFPVHQAAFEDLQTFA
jgi:hypothetical protein